MNQRPELVGRIWKIFLLDHWPYILHFYLGSGLAIAVITLSLAESRMALGWVNLGYMLLLATATLVAFLAVQYARQHDYLCQLQRALLSPEEDLDNVLQVQSAATPQQQAVQQLLHVQHRRYLDMIYRIRRDQELHNRFMNRWVHQMKTPVSVIDLLSERGGREMAPEARNLFQSIAEENRRMAHGLNTMLQWARLNRFELDIRVQRVKLKELVRKVINEHKTQWIHEHIFPRIEGDDVEVETDGKWLAFIVQQLISNALKYSRLAPEAEHVVFRILQLSPDEVVLEVEDEGIGIPDRDLPRVFDPFFTGENGRRVRESTGMGLYFVKEVCKRLGHRVEIYSNKRRGTTVALHFYRTSLHHVTNLKASGALL